uniref:C2H2-type domain-containing protein n=1 Tax=Gouania willdenowi TaxID=441366 RepID=A0A8C5GNR9_GOUWI
MNVERLLVDLEPSVYMSSFIVESKLTDVKTFTHRSHLTLHMQTHSRTELYRCDHCGKIYKHKRTLIIHLRSHTGHEVCGLKEKINTMISWKGSRKKFPFVHFLYRIYIL